MNSITQVPFQQTTVEPGLDALLKRLESQAQAPDFQVQREVGLTHVLRPYLETGYYPFRLFPLPQEIELASLYLYSDYFPADGHPTLIEQVRDLITEHVPQEEREWLDAVRHSYMDLLEVTHIHVDPESTRLTVRSLGDKQEFHVKENILSPSLKPGQTLLTRLIRRPDKISLPGAAVTLSQNLGQVMITFLEEERRNLEIQGGEFALADWTEFAKKYGYLFLWTLSRVRSGATSAADAQIQYSDTKGNTYLYAIALYDHHESHNLKQQLDQFQDLIALSGKEISTTIQEKQTPPLSVWEQRRPTPGEKFPDRLVARITMTPSQLFIEADSGEELDTLKHRLARAFGFSLHFRGEITTPPAHIPPQVDLLSDTFEAPAVTVTQEEDLKVLQSFLESVYLDWAERPCPSLRDESPRHVASRDGSVRQVAELLDQMEQHDLAYQRTGTRGYDYNILRGHVGL